MNNIYHNVLEQLRSGSRIVLATVVRTSGSTPQKPGSSALFSEEGLIAGTVGGGSLEGEVHHIARSVLISGVSDHYYFNLNTDQSDEGSICGGEEVVLIDANPGANLKALEEMEQSHSLRRGGYLMTTVSAEYQNGRNINRYWVIEENQDTLPSGFDPIIKDAISVHLRGPAVGGFSELELPKTIQVPFDMIFFEPLGSLPHLVIVGAGHIGKALAHIGRLLDFEITVIDDRPEFANQENIPDADHLVNQDIGMAMSEQVIGPDTYIVLVSRGHNHDAEALKPCIGSTSAYLGMIGSYRKVGLMKKRFVSEGWATKEEWSRVHAPIGLPIGSVTVQEIAISIAAQLVSVRHQNNKNNAG